MGVYPKGLFGPREGYPIPYSIPVTSRYWHTIRDMPFHDVLDLGIDLITSIAYHGIMRYTEY